jgi:hypothetical protein
MHTPGSPFSPARLVPGLVLLLAGLILAGCGTDLPANGMREAGDGTDPFARQALDPWAVRLPDLDQHHADSTTISAQHTFGQTFVAGHNELNAVAVRLVNPPALTEDSIFELRAGADGPVLRSVPLRAADWSTNPYLTVTFPPVPDSAGKQYYAQWHNPRVPISTELVAFVSRSDTYSAGAETDDAGPAGHAGPDLTFRTFYAVTPAGLLADSVGGLAANAGFALAVLLFLLLPGGAALQLARVLAGPTGPGLGTGQRWLAAPGVSLLLWPVALLGLYEAHIRIDAPALWAGMGLAGLVLAAGLWQERVVSRQSSIGIAANTQHATRNTQHRPLPTAYRLLPTDTLFWLGFAAVGLLTLAGRLRAIRDLAAGLGIDAYHHTAIAQLFVQDGGIPDSYAPFAPLTSFTYPFGFHAWTAALAWLHGPAGLDMARLMPLAGQAVGVLLVPGFTLFGWRVLGNRWVGLVAAGLAGLVALYPAYYVNWSRYPQLLGVVLLPTAWTILFEALAPGTQPRPGRSPLRQDSPTLPSLGRLAWGALAALTAAGLFLSHYRLFLMYATYAAGYGVWVLCSRQSSVVSRQKIIDDTPNTQHATRNTPQSSRFTFHVSRFAQFAIRNPQSAILLRGLAIAGAAGLILLPWLLNVRAHFIVRFSGSTDPQYRGIYDVLGRLGDLPPAYWSTVPLLIMAGAGWLWALWRRDVPVALLGGWLGLHLLFGTPNGLPGSGYVDSVTVATSAFLPLCLLVAWFVVRGPWPVVRGLWGAGVRGRKSDDQKNTQHATRNTQYALAAQIATVILGLLIGVYGVERSLQLQEAWPYVSAADRVVLDRLAAISAPGARVASAAFTYPWAPQTYQGADAGLWAPLLAGRPGTVPMLPAYNEQVRDPGYFAEVGRLSQALDAVRVDALRQAGVGYIFIGSRNTTLSPVVLQLNPDLTLAAHQDDAWLFRLK